ncbi:MAG TPA: hypothetical protein VK956_17525 [Verrucomicrobium sp.]|nr:hypothetical protein [Verrucomicrobium sp.]
MAEVVQPPALQSSMGNPPRDRLRHALKTVWAFLKKYPPLTALLIYTGLSLAFKENYPFSNYPMYSNPSSERPYYTIADGEGKPIAVQKLTGVTCPKIGKIFRKKAEEEAKKHDIKAKDLPPGSVQKVCDEIFAQLRHEAAGKKQTPPAQLKLIKTYISFRDGQVVEETELIGAEILAQTAPSR